MKQRIVCAGSVMFAVCVIVSVLTLLTFSMPQSPCHHCCDDDFLPDEASTALPPAVPEIRTYINMTILKGNLIISPWDLEWKIWD